MRGEERGVREERIEGTMDYEGKGRRGRERGKEIEKREERRYPILHTLLQFRSHLNNNFLGHSYGFDYEFQRCI